MVNERIIVKIRENKSNGQKMVTIPSDSELKSGDYVEIVKLEK